MRRQQDLEEEGRRRREEQLEKAHVRGRQALRREQLLQVPLLPHKEPPHVPVIL